MKNIFIAIVFSFSILSFSCFKSELVDARYQIAFVQEIFVDNGNDINEKGTKDIRNYIGLFGNQNDTVKIFKLKENLKEKPEEYFFWIKNESNNNKVIIHCSESNEDVLIVFKNNNTISVNRDIYTLNTDYYQFLKDRVLSNHSILDLAYFLKDGYGDYSTSLDVLNKNWKNQKHNFNHKIISVKVQNKNYQTDDQYFDYKLDYSYDKNGVLKNIIGGNNFTKKQVNENKKYLHYTISKTINERAIISEELYVNKRDLFDSIVGNNEQYTTNKVFYYSKYQTQFKTVSATSKPVNVEKMVELLKIKL
ncbi:hypothetical protein B4N84_11375 [Flavobacterium sp. IR1]|nr:hypothetical protein B4N84_11375 [Flavobacterium sp. IR1]